MIHYTYKLHFHYPFYFLAMMKRAAINVDEQLPLWFHRNMEILEILWHTTIITTI